MKQVKIESRKLFYFLIALILLRPSLDILSNYSWQLHSSLPAININMIIGSFVFVIIGLYLATKIKEVWSTPLFWLIKIFLALGFVSIFYSVNSIISAQEFIRIATIFLLYLLAYKLTSNKEDFFLIIKAIIFSYVLPAIFGIWQFVFRLGLPDDYGGFLRVFGTFAHPNPFAFYTFFVLSLIVGLALSKKLDWTIYRKHLWPAAALLMFLLLATYTRSAFFAFFLYILFFSIFKYRKLLLIGAIIFIAAYLFFPAFQQRLWELTNLDPYGSVVWRFRLWADMWPVALWQPWSGQGLGVFNEINEFYRGLSFGSLDAHNDYLKILIENGILGLISYLTILTSVLICLWKNFRQAAEKYKGLALALLIIVLSLSGVSFFDNILRGTALQWNLWILIGSWFKMKQMKII